MGFKPATSWLDVLLINLPPCFLVSQKNDVKLDHINSDPSELVLPTIHARNDLSKIREIGEKIKKFYFGHSSISNETLQEFVKVTVYKH